MILASMLRPVLQVSIKGGSFGVRTIAGRVPCPRLLRGHVWARLLVNTCSPKAASMAPGEFGHRADWRGERTVPLNFSWTFSYSEFLREQLATQSQRREVVHNLKDQLMADTPKQGPAPKPQPVAAPNQEVKPRVVERSEKMEVKKAVEPRPLRFSLTDNSEPPRRPKE
jgi:hypothetical protein